MNAKIGLEIMKTENNEKPLSEGVFVFVRKDKKKKNVFVPRDQVLD